MNYETNVELSSVEQTNYQSFNIDLNTKEINSDEKPDSSMLTKILVNDNSDIWKNKVIESMSLPEFNGGIDIDDDVNSSWCKIMFKYAGPGTLVAVGYMDPGNWSTDIAGGSSFGYSLLFIILLSSLMAMFLQVLSLKLGLATNRDLAQVCRDSYSRPVVIMLWIISEIAICATDIAEVIGSAIAMKLLFGLPLVYGVCITALDVLVILFLNGKNFRILELIVATLVGLITVCFIAQLIISKPEAIPLLKGFLPSRELLENKEMLYIGVGIIGATVMPHNLFLHSSIILTRKTERNEESIKKAIYFSSIDSNFCLCIAFFVNAAILMVSAASFHKNGLENVTDLEDAYHLMDPILHSTVASTLFGVALLASGQNSTLTGTLTGQIIMEGFMSWKISPTFRRIITRLLAIIPSVIAVIIGGDSSANALLIFSQVILSFALPFAVIPLVHITSSKERMGIFTNTPFNTFVAIVVISIILILNVVLLF
jgi:manganese transport protein